MTDEAEGREQLNVTAIESGTVIDHVDNDATFEVADLLQVESEDGVVLVGMNLPSRKLGRKGIIKVARRQLTSEEANKIALIAPHATLNIIKDYQVVSKSPIELPDRVRGIVRCFNPTCVTNQQPVETHFEVTGTEPPVLRCLYCEKSMTAEDVMLE